MKRFTPTQVANRLSLSRGRVDQLMRQGDLAYKVDPVTGWRLITERELVRFEKLRNGKPKRKV